VQVPVDVIVTFPVAALYEQAPDADTVTSAPDVDDADTDTDSPYVEDERPDGVQVMDCDAFAMENPADVGTNE
jgi:hypothetical protein